MMEDPATNRLQAFVDQEDGKSACTVIEQVLREHQDGTALLSVRIETGRFHQIRCHLQHAGFPIANDANYGGRAAPTQLLYQDNAAGELRAMLEKHRSDHCEGCAYFLRVLAGEEPAPTLEPTVWLHSWRYEFPTLGHAFEAQPPAWAQDLQGQHAGLDVAP